MQVIGVLLFAAPVLALCAVLIIGAIDIARHAAREERDMKDQSDEDRQCAASGNPNRQSNQGYTTKPRSID